MKKLRPDTGAKSLVDLEQLRSACDGDAEVLRRLMELYFKQAGQIMTGLGQAIEAGNVEEVDHFSHKLAGSCLSCGLTGPVPALRHLEQNAKDGHLHGAPDWFAQVEEQLEALRRFMKDYHPGKRTG